MKTIVHDLMGNLQIANFMADETADELHPNWALEEAQRLSRIGSYEVDLEINRGTWSKQAAINFGYPADTSMHAVDWKSAIHPDDADSVRSHWKSCIEDKKDWNLEYRIIRPNGEVAIIHALGKILLSLNGSPLKMIGTLHDITERKRVEAKLRDQEATLIHASRLSSLGEMASGMAHEINNPLTVIYAKLYTLQKSLKTRTNTTENARHISDCDSAIRMVDRIESIIRGLRTFASDGEKNPFAKTKASAVVNDALALCRYQFSRNEINFILHSDCEDLEIECKSVQISQIIVNLLVNASEALQEAPHKTIELTVTRIQDRIEFRVSDSGAGIPEELRKKIMDPFFTTKEVGKGIGLGLSISLGIANAHGGKLYLDEAQSKTTFVLSLPIQRNKK